MPNMEKVIKGLEQFRADLKPFCGNHADWERFDAGLSMLKEQDAVEPYITGSGESFETAETWWYECGNCNRPIDPNDKFCRYCGRSVKWE